MILKNPEKLLKTIIPSTTGDLWFVKDVNVLMDEDITYEFKLVTQVPVKSFKSAILFYDSCKN
jgi:hypothetical protein